jgi:hypothetical protein
MTATHRTLKKLREDGYLVDVVERFIPRSGFSGVRKDLFGLFDLLAIKPGEGFIGIQCFTTTWSKHFTVLEKEKQNAITWLQSGGRIEFWGWRRLKVKRGGKAIRWTPRIEVIDLGYFEVD